MSTRQKPRFYFVISLTNCKTWAAELNLEINFKLAICKQILYFYYHCVIIFVANILKKKCVFLNLLIKGITAVLPEGCGYTTRVTDVYVGGGVILSVGAAPEGFRADKTISGGGKLLVQGLVNAHTHAYMSLFRGRADDLGFDDWLFRSILPMEQRLLPDDFYWGMLLGICEMIRSGATSFLDMHMMPEKCALAAKESGMRSVLSRGLVGESRLDKGGLRRIREAEADIEQFKGCEKLSFMLAPHAPYSCSPDFLEAVAETAKALGVGINIHLSESAREVRASFVKHDLSPVALINKTGLFDLPCTAAHCVRLAGGDINILSEKGVSVVTCPVSNLKLGNGVAPVPELLQKGVTVALGTDGAASNNSLNMLRELSFLALIHKGVRRDPLCVTAHEALKIATLNGARALGLEKTGEIRVGFNADFAIMRLDTPAMNPPPVGISSLCYSDCSSSVETVIVGGEIIMENGCIKTIDEERVIFEAGRISGRLGSAQTL